MRNIVLIGFMATGKSTIGHRLARRLKHEFIDTDKEIENITGKSVSQIFAQDGVLRFRSEEALLVKKLAARENLVIATGGGLVLNPENVRLLKKNGILIGLTAPPGVIYNRVKRKRNRPLLNKGNARKQIERLLAERRNAYAAADYMLDTADLFPEQAVTAILNYLKEKQEL